MDWTPPAGPSFSCPFQQVQGLRTPPHVPPRSVQTINLVTLQPSRFHWYIKGAAAAQISCREKNGFVAEYALHDLHKTIGVSDFQITAPLLDDLRLRLPTVEELEAELGKPEEASPGGGFARWCGEPVVRSILFQVGVLLLRRRPTAAWRRRWGHQKRCCRLQ